MSKLLVRLEGTASCRSHIGTFPAACGSLPCKWICSKEKLCIFSLFHTFRFSSLNKQLQKLVSRRKLRYHLFLEASLSPCCSLSLGFEAGWFGGCKPAPAFGSVKGLRRVWAVQVGFGGYGVSGMLPSSPCRSPVYIRHRFAKGCFCPLLWDCFHSMKAKAKKDPFSGLRGSFQSLLGENWWQLKIPSVREQLEIVFRGETTCCQPNETENSTMIFLNFIESFCLEKTKIIKSNR